MLFVDAGDPDGGLQRPLEPADRQLDPAARLQRPAMSERGVRDRRESDGPRPSRRQRQQDSARRTGRRHRHRRPVTFAPQGQYRQ